MLIGSIRFSPALRPVASNVPDAPALDVVEVSGRKIELRTARDVETHRFLTGETKETHQVEPRARQLISLEKDGCAFSSGDAVQAYYSPAPVTVLYNFEPVTQLPAYEPGAEIPQSSFDKAAGIYLGTPEEAEFRELLALTRQKGMAERAMGDPELKKLLHELKDRQVTGIGNLVESSDDPLADRSLLLAAGQYDNPIQVFQSWAKVPTEDRSAFERLLEGKPRAESVMPAWTAISSDREHLQQRSESWQSLQTRLKDPDLATQVLRTFPQGDPAPRLKLLDKLLVSMEPPKALEHFAKVHGSEATHKLHQVSRQPAQVEAARQWLTRTDLADAEADQEERLATLAELAQANGGDLKQAQRDYLFVASRSQDWKQMQGMAAFLARLTELCQDPREGRLAFAALDLLPPGQAAPRADNLLKSLELTGSFSHARPLWSALLQLTPEEGADRMQGLPALPHSSPAVRQQLLLGQVERPLREEALVELASLVADPRDPACADEDQSRALLHMAYQGPGEETVHALFELRQRAGNFAESWAVHRYGPDDPEDARQAYQLLKSETALAEVAAQRQPGERLSDLARLYRSQKPGFGELVERVRVEREDVALDVVCKSLERASRPDEAWKLVSPPILAESLQDRLEAYAALPVPKADVLYKRLTELADVSDDLPRAARSLASLSKVAPSLGSLMQTIDSRRQQGDLRRPLHGIFDAVGEAIVKKGGSSLTPQELDEALVRATAGGIQETQSHILVGGVSLTRRAG